MAGTTGLEPATSAVTGQRSNQLNYVPNWIALLAQSSVSLTQSLPILIRDGQLSLPT